MTRAILAKVAVLSLTIVGMDGGSQTVAMQTPRPERAD